MSALRRMMLPTLFLVATLVGCGGGGDPDPTDTQTLSKVAGDNQTTQISTAVAIAPKVKVVDQDGAALSGVQVVFAAASGGGSVTGGTVYTNSVGEAVVGSWTLGSTAGANTLTATVSGAIGSPVTFSATATAVPSGNTFAPTANTTLSGSHQYTTITIPAGVTVTLTGDATITATGAVSIAGTITGSCVNFSLTTDGALTVTGSVNNGCATVPDPVPLLKLVGKGGYTLTGSTITSSGSLEITNDPTLTDATFAAAVVFGPALRASRIGVCIVSGASFVASPLTAAPGTSGIQNGGNGKDASNWTLRCSGELDVNGNILVQGQNGGAGGTGTHTSGTAALSTGGKGGKGGKISVQALGDVVLGGSNTIRSGSGGPGGSSTATGTTTAGVAKGANATATGGDGGDPGLLEVRSKNGGITIGGALTLVMGGGGEGGAATALGAAGSAPCPTSAGGDATATGGKGGSTPDKTLSGSNVGGLGNVTVTGGNAGIGGAATATAGQGNNGAQGCKPGGAGGAISATGGTGGSALLRDRNAALVGDGGNGGNAIFAGGNGGAGFSDCVALPFEAGGAGGTGGSASGRGGTAGTGKNTPSVGTAAINSAGNGGNGGNGSPLGAAGAAGANGVTGGPAITQPSFTAGNPGLLCNLPKTAAIAVQNDLHLHEQFLKVTLGSPKAVTIVANANGTITVNGLLPNSIPMTGTITGTTVNLQSASGVTINGVSGLTATFAGALNGGAVAGTLTITGTPNGPVSYNVSMP